MNDTSTLPARLLVVAALMTVSALAQAQFKWVDEKGQKHFSDRPPPTSIPLKNILQAPGQRHGPAGASDVVLAVAEAPAAAPAAPTPKPAASPTIAERNAEYRKRVKDQADKEEKEKQETEAKAAKQDNCARAREAKLVLDSGQQIGSIDKNGERVVMDEVRRAQENKRVATALAGCN
ncbi:MAG: DUF4124 domain-containing protein [Massilia sp.]